MQGVVLNTLRKVIPKGNLVLALLITVLAGRFALVALEPWVGVAEEQVKKGIRKVRKEATGSAPTASAKPRGAKGGASASPSPSNRPIRVQALLSVKHGTLRSEVYVNGELVGNTPYAGDLNCKRGDPVSVEIVPRRGTPIVRSPLCRSGTIEVWGK